MILVVNPRGKIEGYESDTVLSSAEKLRLHDEGCRIVGIWVESYNGQVESPPQEWTPKGWVDIGIAGESC